MITKGRTKRTSLHCNTSLHFTTLHSTTLHYTYRHFLPTWMWIRNM